jgi:hypothetical protein
MVTRSTVQSRTTRVVIVTLMTAVIVGFAHRKVKRARRS